MSFKDLKVWGEAHKLVKKIYRLLEKYPKKERFNLCSQLQRAVISIPTNIAEGTGRKTTKELIQYLYQARGSLEEIRYLIFLSEDLEYINEKEEKEIDVETKKISKMPNGLIKSLKKDVL